MCGRGGRAPWPRRLYLAAGVALSALLGVVPRAAVGASEAVAAAVTGALVGDTGRMAAIRFEGNDTFDRDQLLAALKHDFDAQAAAHPRARLSNYVAVLEQKILAGYHREGFFEATVHTEAETNGTAILVRVKEGPRSYCGQLRIKGTIGAKENLRRTVEAALRNPRADDLDWVIWQNSSPAPFDAGGQQVLRHRVEAALAELGYIEPRFTLKLAPGAEENRTDLEVEFESAGTEAVLEEIEINDLFRNTRQQVLDFLKLKPEMAIQPSLAGEVQEKLWQSGRFFKHDVSLTPLSRPGHFKLALKLDEVELAPPLDQPLSPAEDALLKFGERVRHWDAQTEDWVCVVELPLRHGVVRLELALSSAGSAAVLRTEVSNRPPTIKAAGLVAGRKIALYSPGAWRKLIFEPAHGYVPVEFSVAVPKIPFGSPLQSVHFGVSPHFTTPAAKLLDLVIDIPPVDFLCAAHYLEPKIREKELTLTQRDSSDGTRFQLKLDVPSGRLLSADYDFPRGSVRLRTEDGGFARVVNEITAAGVVCSNLFDGGGGGAWLLSLARQAAGGASPLIEPEVLRELQERVGANDPKSSWNELRPHLASIGEGLARLRLLFEASASADVLQPLKSFWETISKGQGEDRFDIPTRRSSAWSPTQQGMAPFAAVVLAEADTLFARGSWPWTVLRETVLALEGAGEYTEDSIQQLRQSEQIGPVGCAVLAGLLSKASPPEARRFAKKGMGLLTPRDFHRDYELLLRTNTVAGDTLRNALALFKNLTSEQTAALAPDAGSSGGIFVRDLTQALRSAPGASADAAWGALARHWDKAVRPALATALTAALPSAESLTNSRALVERGKELLAKGMPTGSALEEMISCFTKAAEQGDVEACYYLGSYYEHVKETQRALLWLEKAARQNYPHTGCRLGDLYSQGEDVVRDMDRAAEWYRQEAGRDCAWSQYRLGRILMGNGKTAEAITWYRRAAERGLTDAMSALGEFYSDDLFNTPDYVEAYVWLRMAASQGNLAAPASLRRFRKKLTADQIVEACKRGAAAADSIYANTRKEKAKSREK